LEFVILINDFYIKYRYNRFSASGQNGNEITRLVAYIDHHLKVQYDKVAFSKYVKNNEDIKTCFGRVIGTIARQYYSVIKERATELGLFTCELRVESHAYKLFQGDFRQESVLDQIIDEQIALKELMIFLVNTQKSNSFYKFLKGIKPLDLDIALINDHLGEILRHNLSQSLIDEIQTLYWDIDRAEIKKRLAILEGVGHSDFLVYSDDDDDDDDDDDEDGE
jgi:hypothetical protein